MHNLKKNSILAFFVYDEIVFSAAINIMIAGRIALVTRRDKSLNLTEAETERSLKNIIIIY